MQGTFSAYMFNLHPAGGALGNDGLCGGIIERIFASTRST
jgi:hypothetical protein